MENDLNQVSVLDMTINYEEMQKRSAQIVICARKRKGLTQSDLSEQLGIDQSTLSRIEKAVLAPPLFTWMELCEFLEIPENALTTGYLDLGSVVKINSSTREGGFKLPRSYTKDRCLSVREIAPIIAFIRRDLGFSVLEKISKEMGMDLNFYTNLDNTVNLKFLEDLLGILSKRKKYGVKDYLKYASDPLSHGILSKQYKNATSQIDLLGRYLKNTAKYQKANDYSVKAVKKGEIKLVVTPNKDLLKSFDNISVGTVKFLSSYREEYFKKFSLYDFNGEKLKPVKVAKAVGSESIEYVLSVA